MAGQKFEYDESGSTFFYFLTSFLGLVLIPCTYYLWSNDEPEEVKEVHAEVFVKKQSKIKKPEKWKGLRKIMKRLILIAGWVLMFYLIYKIQDFDYEHANFDPYDILEVGIGSSMAEIKKAYRTKSKVLHPDKPTGDERKFMRLNKAYQALTDDTARRNFELYGHPDGPSAMHFGIALPSWIVEKENSIWVLGLYGLVFMVALPTVVAIWWHRSSKFSNDQVLLDTTQLYYYFFHKSPQMVFKRALMVLAASLEFEKGHNPEIVERPSDNMELHQLIKLLPNLGEKNKERPLCFAYSIKARALLHAHLSRMQLPEDTLDQDKLYIVKCCPTLIQEMVTCVSQLIMLAHAGRISRLPSLDTIEACMKLCPHIIQAAWETKNPLLQLPGVNEDSLRHFVTKKKPVKSIEHLVSLGATDRRHVLRSLNDEEFIDVMVVCSQMPKITMSVKCEVVDDDDTGVFTAGAIVTVTVLLTRRPLGEVYDEDLENSIVPLEELQKESNKDIDCSKTGWKKPQQKKGAKSKSKPQPQKKKILKKEEEKPEEKKTEDKKEKSKKVQIVEGGHEGATHAEEVVVAATTATTTAATTTTAAAAEESDEDDSASHSDESQADEADTESHKDENKQVDNGDDDVEWERFQKGMTKREKALEGKSRVSHPVHCPYFPEDKQEYWWTYVCDRKKHALVTAPYQVTNLVEDEEVQLKFTAPPKPGFYTYQVCLRSDSYLGLDLTEDIKLDVKEAREIPVEHPQWQECSSDEDDDDDDDAGKDDGEDSEYTTDEELTDDSDEE